MPYTNPRYPELHGDYRNPKKARQQREQNSGDSKTGTRGKHNRDQVTRQSHVGDDSSKKLMNLEVSPPYLFQIILLNFFNFLDSDLLPQIIVTRPREIQPVQSGPIFVWIEQATLTLQKAWNAPKWIKAIESWKELENSFSTKKV